MINACRKRFHHLVGLLVPLCLLPSAGCNPPGLPPPPCYGPDNGQGTVDLPPTCGGTPLTIGPINVPIITNGLNPGDSIVLSDATLLNFTPFPLMPGGALGGDTQHSQADLTVHLRG